MGSKKFNVSVKRLVREECASYSEILNDLRDYCDRENTEGYCCIFFIKGSEDNARCDYFEKAVLPMNPQLEKLYQLRETDLTKEDKEQIVEKESSVAGKVKIHCKKCGHTFQADNYRQQYCKICKKYIQRENQRNWISKKRNANVENQLSETVDI